MGKILTLLVLFLAVLVGVTLYLCPCLLKDPKVPVVPSSRWWGPGQEPQQGGGVVSNIRPFRIQVPEDELLDLKDRLRNSRLSSPLEGATFQYGFNTDYLRSILDYWLNKYDWRKEEAKLNLFPQFLAKIEGIDVHFIHVKPDLKDKKIKVLPLLMIHGWPGSVVEFYKIIPLLTSGMGGVAFEVICPSIPGFGFSEAPHHPGFSSLDAARTFRKLMEALGHNQFYVQGGDWGSHIGSLMSIFYPEKVRGLHLNFLPMVLNNMPAILKYVVAHVAPSLVIEDNQKFNIFPAKNYFSNLILESGYFHIQATKPDTVGVALGDSPIGLAAYILEKFSTGTNIDYREKRDGGLLDKFTLDDLLTNVMVYWVTNTATSSIRLYKENMKSSQRALKLDALPILVPTGIAVFPHEILTAPRSILSHKFRQILTYNFMERGGHFAAFEEPQLLAEDITAFVSACETHIRDQELKSKTVGGKPETKPKNKQSAATKKQEQAKGTKTETHSKDNKRFKEEPVKKRETTTSTLNAEKPVNQAPAKEQEQTRKKVTKTEEKVEKVVTQAPVKPTTAKPIENVDKPTTQAPVKPTTAKPIENVDKPPTQTPVKTTTAKPIVNVDKPPTQPPVKPTTEKPIENVDKPLTQAPPKPTTPVTPKQNSETEQIKMETSRNPPPDQTKHTESPSSKEQPKVESEPAKPEIKKMPEMKTRDDSVKPSTPKKEPSESEVKKSKQEIVSDTSDQKTKIENVPTPNAKDEKVPVQKTEKTETINKPKVPNGEGKERKTQ